MFPEVVLGSGAPVDGRVVAVVLLLLLLLFHRGLQLTITKYSTSRWTADVSTSVTFRRNLGRLGDGGGVSNGTLSIRPSSLEEDDDESDTLLTMCVASSSSKVSMDGRGFRRPSLGGP